MNRLTDKILNQIKDANWWECAVVYSSELPNMAKEIQALRFEVELLTAINIKVFKLLDTVSRKLTLVPTLDVDLQKLLKRIDDFLEKAKK